MKDIQPYIEVIIFLIGWIAVVAAQKQQAKDLNKTVDGMGGKIDSLVTTVGVLGSDAKLHEEQISTLRKAVDVQDRDNNIDFDEIRSDAARHGRKIQKVEKWVVAANQTIKRLESGWDPPAVNGE